MAILEHQHIEFENVLSYKTRVDANRLEELISYVERNTDALGLEVCGSIIFTVNEVVQLPDKQILGIEILVPVNRKFESCEQYVYKPKFRLVNAVSVRFANICAFNEAKDQLNRYLRQNHFNAASEIYYMIDFGCEQQQISITNNALVSINDNIV